MAGLLSPADIRELAAKFGIHPTKKLGQNFVVDQNTVRKIVDAAALDPAEAVLEVGPGLGSLTLALLEAGHPVTAVEIDPALAEHLPSTQQRFQPEGDLVVVLQDALKVTELPRPVTALVANLPYNVSVPVLLHLLAEFPALRRALVMVQAEVGERLAAGPGSKVYGAPSVKASWYGEWSLAGRISRQVFWPVPNVDSVLVRFDANPGQVRAAASDLTDVDLKKRTFRLIDAAFGQRRKMLRGSLSTFFGGSAATETALTAAGIDPTARGETLVLSDFIRLAQQLHQ